MHLSTYSSDILRINVEASLTPIRNLTICPVKSLLHYKALWINESARQALEIIRNRSIYSHAILLLVVLSWESSEMGQFLASASAPSVAFLPHPSLRRLN